MSQPVTSTPIHGKARGRPRKKRESVDVTEQIAVANSNTQHDERAQNRSSKKGKGRGKAKPDEVRKSYPKRQRKGADTSLLDFSTEDLRSEGDSKFENKQIDDKVSVEEGNERKTLISGKRGWKKILSNDISDTSIDLNASQDYEGDSLSRNETNDERLKYETSKEDLNETLEKESSSTNAGHFQSEKYDNETFNRTLKEGNRGMSPGRGKGRGRGRGQGRGRGRVSSPADDAGSKTVNGLKQATGKKYGSEQTLKNQDTEGGRKTPRSVRKPKRFIQEHESSYAEESDVPGESMIEDESLDLSPKGGRNEERTPKTPKRSVKLKKNFQGYSKRESDRRRSTKMKKDSDSDFRYSDVEGTEKDELEDLPLSEVKKSGRGGKRKRSVKSKKMNEESDEEEVEEMLPKKKQKTGRGKGRRKKVKEEDKSKTEDNDESTSQNAEEVEQTCPRCQENQESLSMLKDHLLRAHLALWSRNCPEGETGNHVLKVVHQKYKKINCPACGKDFNSVRYYQTHLPWCGKEDETYQCPTCGRNVKKKWEVQHSRCHAQKEREEEMRKEMKEKLVKLKELEKDDGPVTEGKKRSAAKKAQAMLRNLSQLGDGPGEEDLDDNVDDPDVHLSSSSSSEEEVEDDLEEEEEEGDVEEEDFSDDKERGIRRRTDGERSTGSKRKSTFIPNVYETLEVHEKTNSSKLEQVLMELLPFKANWMPINAEKAKNILPKTLTSVPFCVKLSEKCGVANFHSLSRFESIVDKGSINLFTGGPVWGMAWCPSPCDAVTNQYLALSVYKDMDSTYQLHTSVTHDACIQIWDVGELTISSKAKKASLAVCICHSYGAIRKLVWCPTRCQQSVKYASDETWPRLGLLAAACSDGSVRIYSIPHPQSLRAEAGGDCAYPLICEPHPVMSLLPTHPDLGSESPCLCMAWQFKNDHQFVLGGFGNGIVHIWNLSTKSSLQKVQTKSTLNLLPFRSFKAHTQSVIDCSWSPHLSDVVVTCGRHSACLWNIDNVDTPIQKSENVTGTSIGFGIGLTAYFVGQDDFLGTTEGILMKLGRDKELTVPYRKLDGYVRWHNYASEDSHLLTQPLVNLTDCIWGFDTSGWLSTTFAVNTTGQVVGSLVQLAGYQKSMARRLILSQTKPVENPHKQKSSAMANSIPGENTQEVVPCNSVSAINDELESKKSKKSISSKSKGKQSSSKKTKTNVSSKEYKTYEEAVNDLALEYTDSYLFTRKVQQQMVTDDDDVNSFPLAALYRCAFNPNLQACSYLAFGGQAGIVRIMNNKTTITDKVHVQLTEVLKDKLNLS